MSRGWPLSGAWEDEASALTDRIERLIEADVPPSLSDATRDQLAAISGALESIAGCRVVYSNRLAPGEWVIAMDLAEMTEQLSSSAPVVDGPPVGAVDVGQTAQWLCDRLLAALRRDELLAWRRGSSALVEVVSSARPASQVVSVILGHLLPLLSPWAELGMLDEIADAARARGVVDDADSSGDVADRA
jgi:hypothetical protein